MSNLIEAYALSCGLKIDKPYLHESYFPIPFDKFVTIQNSSGMDSKNYDYWQEVINLVYPFLKERDIQIIQLGDNKAPALGKCYRLCGKTNIHQSRYIVGKSMLHIGNDSWLAHLASSLNVPVVALYGPTTPKNHGPYFGDTSQNILIESHRNGNKPAFASAENPKTINYIRPEEVANAILKSLKVKGDAGIETIHIGKRYTQFMVDVVMDTIISPEFLKGNVFNARMDYLFNEDILSKNLSLRKFFITTDKPINLNILKKYKQNIDGINYIITEKYDLTFLQDVVRLGIPYVLTSYLDEEYINKIKIDFFDFNIINKISCPTKESLDFLDKINIYTVYKTNKFLLGGNKIYSSKPDWEKDNPIPSFEENISKLDLDSESILENLDFLYIFNKNNK